MKKVIKNLCKALEEKYDIRILFAVENGSRAWRMESKDSDYDVRFVFYRSPENYLRIDKLDEVINCSFDENCDEKERGIIDVLGFDIFKFGDLLNKSNPTVIEWLVSDIVYFGKQPDKFVRLAKKSFNPRALFYHYKSLCKQNYIKYLNSEKNISYKKYLYAYRGLINAKYVLKYNKVPRIIFSEALDELNGEIPENVFNRVKEIIQVKSEGNEKDQIKRIKNLDRYIEKFLKENEKPEGKKKSNLIEINKEIQRILL